MLLVDKKSSADKVLKIITDEVDFIAVDTEFIRENLKIPLLCLIQIATLDDVFIIDPMEIDILFLKQIFESQKIKKVFHSAYQDIEMLSTYGISVKNFHDTQLYEAVLSTSNNISYRAIVFKYLNKKLKKNCSMSDWSKRPLSKKQLRYSEEDVLYLREVYKKQFQELVDKNRLNWIDGELFLLKEDDDKFQLTLSKNNLAVYNQLIEWREQKAIEKNVNPELIAGDHVIKTICKKGVDFIKNIKNSRNTKDDNYREFLFFAEKIAGKLEVKEKSAKQNTIISLLKILLDIRSQEHNISQSIIATTKDLEKLSNGNNDVKCLSGWRSEIFGKDASLLLRGKISLRVCESKIISDNVV